MDRNNPADEKLFISWVVSIRWRRLLPLQQRFHSKETNLPQRFLAMAKIRPLFPS